MIRFPGGRRPEEREEGAGASRRRDNGGLIALSVRRPVLTMVLNLMIIVAGLAALLGVEVRELPNVDRPIVSVRASYPGAVPEVVDSRVTSILEGAVARVPGVTDISARSSAGSGRVTIEFSPSTDLNEAANEVREAISRIQRRLPDGMELPQVIKADDDASAIMQISVVSPSLTIDTLTELVDRQVIDRLASVDGVADVQVWGGRNSEIRVAVDTTALAARGLTISDVEAALGNASLDAPAGTLAAGSRTLVVRADAAIQSAEEVAALIVSGSTRIGDVAEVEAGPEERNSGIRRDGDAGISLGIIRQAGANTLDISSDIKDTVEALRTDILEDVDIQVTADEGVFIDGAVREVASTLLIATAIVISIIFVFLRSWRTTLIPAVTVPVAIIGAVAGIWLAGFSINILTLLALVLATGMVVDDAIVVLENIERHKRMGMGPRAAAVLGTRQVFFAVLATTATLAAVFIPISFLPGTAGGLFAEFGFVLAGAVALSSFVALTLAPMMASRLGTGAGKPSDGAGNDGPLEKVGGLAVRGYRRSLAACLGAPWVTLAVFGAFAVVAVQVFLTLPEELTPDEDRGIIRVVVSSPTGASLDYTDRQVAVVEEAIQPLRATGEISSMLTISGRGGGQTGFISLQLADWRDRDRSQAEITADIEERLADFAGARLSTRSGNSLGIRGGGSGLRFAVVGGDYGALADAADDLVERIEDRLGGLRGARVAYDTTQPQLSVSIDRERAADLGVPINAVSATVQAMLDGRDAADLFVGDQVIPIRLVPQGERITGPGDLENLFVTAEDGRTVPLSSFVSLHETAIAPSLGREAQRRAVPLSAGLADDYSLRNAMTDIRALAQETLPAGMSIAFQGEAAALDETATGFAWVFAFALVIVLLVLAAQFESFISAVIIIATVPLGLAAAVVVMGLTAGSLNLYSQIGLIMIIGLMAKNGILIVEFANQLRDQGRNVHDAIQEACEIRFRPVVMTMVSTVLGGLPLILSAGAGAEAREALGWIVVGGLGVSTLTTLYLTPVVFRVLAGLSRPRAAEGERLEREMADAERDQARGDPEGHRVDIAAE